MQTAATHHLQPDRVLVDERSARRGRFFESERLNAALLSGVAGYVDTAGFLALFGLLPAHLTGDLVSVGAEMARPQVGIIARFSVIPLFMIAVAVAAVVARSSRSRGEAPLAPLLVLMTLALAVFCAAGVLLKGFVTGPDAWAVVLIGGTAVIAMGIQNALMREALGSFCATTVMTGNLTQFTIDLVEILYSLMHVEGDHRRHAMRVAKARLFRFGIPIASFVVGATLGAWLTKRIGLSSIAVPTLVVGLLAHGARRYEEVRRSVARQGPHCV